MVWYYVIGSGAALYGIFGFYKSMVWICRSILRRMKKEVSVSKSSPVHSEARIDIDPIIVPSPHTLRPVKRIPSFNRAFSCPATPKMNGLLERNEKW